MSAWSQWMHCKQSRLSQGEYLKCSQIYLVFPVIRLQLTKYTIVKPVPRHFDSFQALRFLVLFWFYFSRNK